MRPVIRKKIPKKPKLNLSQWKQLINQMADEVQQWALEKDWSVFRDKKVIEEDGVKYEVPVLRIRNAAGEVWFDPAGTDYHGAVGRIDLSYWPTMDSVRLILRDGEWQVFSPNDARIRRKWGRSLFYELAANPPLAIA